MAGFVPLPQNASTNDIARVTNRALERLDGESVTKTYRQPGGNAVITGKLPHGGYGTLYYDADGVPVILIGQAPGDKRMGIWQVEPGKNVIEELGG